MAITTPSFDTDATSRTNTPTITNPNDPTHPLLVINLSQHSTIKLTPINYLSWQQQFASFLIGYDLQGYVDGSLTPPPSTITANGTTTLNPEYSTWHRQDRLIFSALIDSLPTSVAPLLYRATSSRNAWLILANTYAKPSRGHIKQVKKYLKNPQQGTQTISEYMQFIRTRADQLAILGKSMEDEDLIDHILDSLDLAYKSIVDAVNARDTPITFNVLHEKLLHRELSVRASLPLFSLPMTVNPAGFHPRPCQNNMYARP